MQFLELTSCTARTAAAESMVEEVRNITGWPLGDFEKAGIPMHSRTSTEAPGAGSIHIRDRAKTAGVSRRHGPGCLAVEVVASATSAIRLERPASHVSSDTTNYRARMISFTPG